MNYFLFFFFIYNSFLFFFCWNGCVFYCFLNLSFSFSLMRLIILIFIYLFEYSYVLLYLSYFVVIFSIFFFYVLSLFLFFFIYEIIIFPIFFIVFFFGSQPFKINALYYAIFYTSGFSFPFIYVIVNINFWPFYIYVSNIFLFFCVGLFLVKSPLFILHFWLPKVHVEAPTVGSILLAGLLLKVGIFGLIKILILIKIVYFWFYFLSLLGMFLGSFFSIFSRDSKVLAAYSSISHINLVVYGLSLFSLFSNSRSLIISVSHGYVSSIMFCFIGYVYLNNNNRLVYYSSGLFFFGWLCVLFSIMIIANCGLPLNISFFGELFILSILLNWGYFVIFFVFIYFVYSFYYSIYFILHNNKPGINLYINIFFLGLMFFSLFYFLNFFLFLFY